MSWDVIVENYGGEPPDLNDEMVEPKSLGGPAAIRKKFDAQFPGIEWTSDRDGVFESDEFLIEITIGSENPIKHVMLSVRGDGDPLAVVAALAKANKWSLFDCSASEYLDLDKHSAGFEEFQAFRDRALPTNARKTKGRSPRRKK